ncbi:MAG: lipid-A-disaccharide synthase [Deltaproteobacteria bacterium]|nr:lipid-A-disaccharide synthase [Deltaproteobacteria bacterium]
MKLLAIAGEPSGDQHGGALLAGLYSRIPGLQVSGIGGPRMTAQGLSPLHSFQSLQVHGLVEVLRHLPRLYRILWDLERRMDEDRPDALLTIDYPGFNLKLAQAAAKRSIPVIHYSSPQVWAWRSGRIQTIARSVSKLIVLFPFEEDLYRKSGVNAEFVGHPLVGQEAPPEKVSQLLAGLKGSPSLPLVALMPGSRASELERHLAPLLGAVKEMGQRGFQARWVMPLAPGLNRTRVEEQIRQAGVIVQVLEGGFLPLLKLAQLALVASGTAALQTALAGIPMVVFYKLSPLTYQIARRVVKLPHVSMVNILAGREIVPERLQQAVNPLTLADTFLALAQSPTAQAAMKKNLAQVTTVLGKPGAYDRGAEAIARFLNEH